MSDDLPVFPEQWQVAQIRRKLRGADGIRIGPFGSALTLDQMVEDGFKVYGQENVIAEDFTAGTRYLSPTKYAELKSCSIASSDVLVTMMGTTGRCCVVPEGIADGIMDSHLIRLRFQDHEVDPSFLALLIDKGHYVKEQINAAGKGTIMSGLNSSIIKEVWVGLPELAVQRRIIKYIGEQTSKIDQLMAMRRRQMELLKEQRAALIQQAVTRGLNPAVPMKDSGIPWLGEIPAHWDVLPLKRELKFVTSGSRGWAEHYSDTGKLFLRIGNLTRDTIELDLSDVQLVDVPLGAEGERTRVQPGDLLISITADLGSIAVAPDGIEESYVSQHVALARPTRKSSFSRWLGYVLLSRVGKVQLEMGGLGGTKIQLALDDIKSLLILIPPKNEQEEIVEFIENGSKKIEKTITAYARQLTLLAEYRAALIHECVTGKRLVAQRTEVEASPTKANVHFLRAVLCSEIVHRLHEEPTFGRVKLEKILFLSEAYAGIDLEGHYLRAAAGPFDNRALRSAESQIQKQKWYQPVKGEKGTRYIPLEKAGEQRKYFNRYWPEQQPKFDRIVDLLRKEKTEFCEIVATLFSAWRDRLHSGQSCADAALVDEVLTNWHPSKQRIPRERWLNALEWMKKQGLTPTITPSPPKE